MCVIEKKTYIHPDGRREIVPSLRRCHRAPVNGVCQHVEERIVEEPYVLNEVRPTVSNQQPREDLVVTNDKVYRRLSRRKNSQSASARPNRNSLTPTQAVASSSSSPSRPLSGSYGSDHPPPLDKTITKESERLRQSRLTSGTPASAKDTANQPKVTYRIFRPSNVTPGTSPASNRSTSPILGSYGLSNPPPLGRRADSVSSFTTEMPRSSRAEEKRPVRDDGPSTEADRRADVYARLLAKREDDRRKEEARARTQDEQQARVMQDTISSTDRYQKAREAAAEAKARERQRKQDEADARERRDREAKFTARQQELQRQAERAKELDRLRRQEAAQAEEDARLRAQENHAAALAALESERVAAQRIAEAKAHQASTPDRINRQVRLAAEKRQMAVERAGNRERDSVTPYSAPGPAAIYPSDPRSSPLSPRLPTSSALALGGPATQPAQISYSARNPRTVILHQDPAPSPATAGRRRRESFMLGRGEDLINQLSPTDSPMGGAGPSSFSPSTRGPEGWLAEMEALRLEDEGDVAAEVAAMTRGGEDAEEELDRLEAEKRREKRERRERGERRGRGTRDGRYQ